MPSAVREIKVFQASVRAPDQAEAVPFQLDCFDAEGNVAESHTFTAYGDPDDAGIGMTIIDLVRYDDKGRQVADLHAIKGLLRRVLADTEFAQFESLLDRKDVYLQMETLGAIYQYLIEEFSARPTQPRSISQNGRPRTGQRSMAGHSSPAST